MTQMLLSLTLALLCTRICAADLCAAQDNPFNGKDLSGWKTKGAAEKTKWKVGKASLDPADAHKLTVAEGAELINSEGKGVDLYSEAAWGDCVLEIEVLVPKGSNSGIYVLGEYEVQVLDSFGKEKVGQGDMGGLYSAAAPKVNASKAPGEWQKFVIDFRAPKFDADGKKTGNATFVKVELNGQVIHDKVEMKGPTPGGLTGKEAAKGPILFQGDHGAVAYRNLKVSPVQ
jgi:hypothetical protein